jgi:hypothetical protein
MSINKLISYKNVLLDLLDELALDHTKYTPMFARWIEKAEKKIGSRYQYKKKIAVLNISGCTAELPSDAAYVQRGIMGNQGCDCQDLFLNVGGSIASKAVSISSSANAAFNNLSFLIVDIVPAGQFTDASNFYYIDYEIQGNKIIFKQNYNGSQITIQYLGIETDCDGLMLIGENHVDAIMWYCKWKFYDRRIRSGIDLGKVRDYKMEWERQCLNARAVDATLTEPERQSILQYIHDPYVGWGLRLQPTLGTWGSVMNGVW